MIKTLSEHLCFKIQGLDKYVNIIVHPHIISSRSRD